MDLVLAGHYYNKSEEFEACFVYYSYMAPPMSRWEGSFLSHDALSHIMTPVMQQRDDLSFFDYFIWTVHVQKHSLLRFGKGSKAPVCEIWWLLVERIVIARTRDRRAVDALHTLAAGIFLRTAAGLHLNIYECL